MKLSVIIVVYKSEGVIYNCLESIEKYNDLGQDLEVVIVDNEVESLLGDKLQYTKYGFTLKYKKSIGNNGFGAGNNLGASVASSNILFFLNPDTMLVEKIFSDIYGRLKDDSNLICGFFLTDSAGKRNNSYSFFYDDFLRYRILSLMKVISYKWPTKSKWANSYIWPWGAAFALNKKTFDKAGGFDENIFLCNEEADLLKRIPGRKVHMSEHRIIHLEGHGTTVSEFRYYQAFKSFRYYQEKYSMSPMNRFLWELYVQILCLGKMLISRNENSMNYVSAYRRFINEIENQKK
jgi:GT2 family glycosyltransferase